ncbi:AGAP011854-PA [Anopheles gambiae str. PEST]|uniref:AGAP011854-PA n=1 Tax=Anopheles gambiae TaxID=7165 RepID=A7UVF8_ANOGA|nr:AGAP011854-PA [Anopheles gambiae str. PEST]
MCLERRSKIRSMWRERFLVEGSSRPTISFGCVDHAKGSTIVSEVEIKTLEKGDNRDKMKHSVIFRDCECSGLLCSVLKCSGWRKWEQHNSAECYKYVIEEREREREYEYGKGMRQQSVRETMKNDNFALDAVRQKCSRAVPHSLARASNNARRLIAVLCVCGEL